MSKRSLQLGLLLATLLMSCEKVIDISVKDTEKVFVIQADLNGTEKRMDVRITKTANYLGTEENPSIENANITLTTPEGEAINIPHLDNGFYSAEVEATSNAIYSLSVEIDGETYTAESKLVPPVPIDSLAEFIFPGAGGPPREVGRLFGIHFKEPAETKNYYQIVYFLNGEPNNSINVVSDLGTNGTQNTEVLFVGGIVEGDTIETELRSINLETYEYYRAVSDIAGASTGSSAPGNPKSNWGSKVVGFFNAYSKSTAQLIAEE